MKKIIKIGIPIVSIFLLIACGNSENKKQENPQDSEASASIPKDNAIRIDDDVLNAIYSQYVHLTVALTQDNLAEAKLAANAIEAGASEINNSNLAAFAAAIVSAPDIDKQRAAYSKLSNEMVGLLKKAGMAEAELYVEYCPMAFDNKGAVWVSSTKEVRNPYFGEKMLNCGEVKEIIK
ncbi:MAG: DUF3347 domain-containing protein [Flavobacterium sp.]|jgi:hypothetical protein|uniref:DUF3347 domain-containing protein n=1 Tax=Flavobacterium lindanitolerans TaxID=428988 RepID=UPI00103ADBEC|nr:DUF3347 domain-containing protein [Flavobacterium lindanitolerans]MBU7571378.1 DUF3347 domain-containing protein [Flavobacterium sp.]THD34230.1 MAG: DUF3347 domain-containing protein [Flavobacterium johnsoniae]